MTRRKFDVLLMLRVEAGYALFSAGLIFCFCSNEEDVSFQQYDFEHKEWQTFIESHKMPRKGKTYCINEGNCAKWDSFIATFVAQNLRGRSVRWMCELALNIILLKHGSSLFLNEYILQAAWLPTFTDLSCKRV